jgi:hypothetical protein
MRNRPVRAKSTCLTAAAAVALAMLVAAPARAARSNGYVSVGASVVYSTVVRPAQVVSVRSIAARGGTRTVASVLVDGAATVTVGQQETMRAPVATGDHTRSVELRVSGTEPVVVTVFTDAVNPASARMQIAER